MNRHSDSLFTALIASAFVFVAAACPTAPTIEDPPAGEGEGENAGEGEGENAGEGEGENTGEGEGEGENAGEGEGETFPACTTITGTAAITFTRDEGATLAP